jgi:putative colanic acid biosynthesis acetyltransferase WcaF
LKTDLSTYNNSWYKPGSALKRGCWFLINAIIFKSSLFPFYGLKTSLLRTFGARVGKKVFIKPNVNIKYPWFLEVGDHVWIGEQVWIDNLGKVSIGNHVCLSQGCILLSGNHDYTKVSFDLVIKDIVLEDGVWIGAKAIVCGGTIARDHAVLTAGSVAARELERMGIYSGNPAEWVRGRGFRV